MWAEGGHAGDAQGILSVWAAISRLGLDSRTVCTIDPRLDEHIEWADIVFIHSHGDFGQDGRLQGVIDCKSKKYQGSGVLGSALCADKVALKRMAMGHGLRTPRFFSTDAPVEELLAQAHRLAFPVVAKPRRGGGRARRFDTPGQLGAWLAGASPEVLQGHLVEEFVSGDVVTVGIIELSQGPCALTWEVPAACSPCVPDLLKEFALKAFHGAHCAGMAEVHLVVDAGGLPTLLKIDTLPGMAEHGAFARACRALGLTYEEFVLAALRTARRRAPPDAGWRALPAPHPESALG